MNFTFNCYTFVPISDVFLIVAIVVVAVGIGAAVAGYVCWKRRRGLNYARNI